MCKILYIAQNYDNLYKINFLIKNVNLKFNCILDVF